MKKKNDVIWPQYLKSANNKTTHVYLPIKVYEKMLSEVKEYEELQRKKHVAWVKVSSKAKN